MNIGPLLPKLSR